MEHCHFPQSLRAQWKKPIVEDHIIPCRNVQHRPIQMCSCQGCGKVGRGRWLLARGFLLFGETVRGLDGCEGYTVLWVSQHPFFLHFWDGEF